MKKVFDESRTIKFIKNSASMFLYQGLLLISGFILPRVMLSFYGSEINGLVTSITQFISYISLVEAGLSAATVYSLYKPLAEKDHYGISRVVTAAKNFYYKSGWLFLALIGLLAVFYPFFIDMPEKMGYWDVLALVFISGVSGALDFFTLAKYRALLTADQKTYILSGSSAVYIVTNVALLSLMSFLRFDICVAKAVALTAVLLRSVILVVYCKRKYPYIDYKAEPDNNALSKRWDALFQQLLGTVQNGSPVVILTVIAKDLALISVYSIYNMVTSGLNAVLSIFISGLSASFGDIIARGEQETLKKAYSEFETAYYVLISTVYSVALVCIMPFIKIYTSGVTDADYYLPVVGFLFVINGFLYNIKTPQGMLVLSAGLYKETRYRTLTQALLIIIVGVPLTKFFGIYGVLIGLFVSNVYRSIDLLYFIPKNITKLPVFNTIKKWVIMGINMILVFGVYELINLNAENYFQWAAVAVVMCIFSVTTNVILFSIICKNDMLSLIKRVKAIIKK